MSDLTTFKKKTIFQEKEIQESINTGFTKYIQYFKIIDISAPLRQNIIVIQIIQIFTSIVYKLLSNGFICQHRKPTRSMSLLDKNGVIMYFIFKLNNKLFNTATP